MAEGTEPSVVRHSAGLHLFLWLAFPLLGGAIGWVLSRIPRWSQDLAWIPFQGPLDLLDQLSGGTTTGVLVGLGVIVGGVVALTAYDDIVRIDVARDVVRFTRAGEVIEIPGADVAGAFTDGKFMVLVDSAGGELAREKTDHKASRIQPAFAEQGFVWHDADPYAGDFAWWVEGTPGLDERANALLKRRQKSLESGKNEELRDLRTELSRLGVFVRDEKKRQYWRTTRQA